MKKKSLLAAALAASMMLPSNLSMLSLATPAIVLAASPLEDKDIVVVYEGEATEANKENLTYKVYLATDTNKENPITDATVTPQSVDATDSNNVKVTVKVTLEATDTYAKSEDLEAVATKATPPVVSPLEDKDIVVVYEGEATEANKENLTYKVYLATDTNKENAIADATVDFVSIDETDPDNVKVKVKVTLPATDTYALSENLEVDATKATTSNVPEEKATSWIINFVAEGATKGTISFEEKDLDNETLAVDSYLQQIPDGFHYVGEPAAINFANTEVTTDESGKKVKIQTVTVKANAASDDVMPTDATTIEVPYTDADGTSGTLSLTGSDLSTDDKTNKTVSSDTLNKNLKGGTTTNSLPLDTLKPIYFEDTDGSLKALAYTPNDSTTPVTVTAEGNLATETDPVEVKLPEGLPPVTLPLNELADKPEQSTLTYEPNYPKISDALTEEMKKLDQENYEGKEPNYKFEVEAPANVDDKQKANDSSIELKDLIIKIKVQAESYIRLLISKATAQKNAAAMMLYSLEIEEAGEDSNEKVALLVKVSQVDSNKDNKITSDEISAYLDKNKATLTDENGEVVNPDELDVKPNFTLDLTESKPYSDVKNGYFEAEITEGKAPVVNSSTGGNKKKPTKPAEEPTTPVVGTPTTMYRLYNKLNGEHLFTTDKAERDSLLTSDTWKDEGQGWTAPSVSDYPVYRLLNPNTGDHHYTTDKNEFDTLPTYGWVAEGIAFFSADKNNTENVILHRLYNPNATGAGSHHYTADTNERDTLVAQGWKYEGTAWAGLPANK